MLTMLNPDTLPKSPAYSQGVLADAPKKMLFVSGQVGVGPDGQVGNGIAEQTRFAIANLHAVLAEAGMDNRNVVKFTIYLTGESLLPGFMEAGSGTLPSPPPAGTLVIVKALAAPSLLVEIEAIAMA